MYASATERESAESERTVNGKLVLPDELTIGEAYAPCMDVTTIEEATVRLTALIERRVRVGDCDTVEEAKALELSNIGYYAGYYDNDTRQRVSELFGAVHPIFGSNYKVTPQEALEAGKRLTQS